jgi:hypothetical protein
MFRGDRFAINQPQGASFPSLAEDRGMNFIVGHRTKVSLFPSTWSIRIPGL